MMDISSEFFQNVLDKVGFDKNIYPMNYYGLLGFLATKWIFIIPYKEDEVTGWQWVGFEIDNENNKIGFSEDFTSYYTYEDMLNAAITESYCYLLSNIENE